MTKKVRKHKKWSIIDRFTYHYKRSHAPGKYGLKISSPKTSYSDGFVEGFDGRNNEASIRREFGNKAANSYRVGYKRGRKAAHNYFEETGKQPHTLQYKV